MNRFASAGELRASFDEVCEIAAATTARSWNPRLPRTLLSAGPFSVNGPLVCLGMFRGAIDSSYNKAARTTAYCRCSGQGCPE